MDSPDKIRKQSVITKMKTTLKTLICTALCCAAWSAFAGGPPADSSTSIAFDNNPVGLVAGIDVTITSTTTRDDALTAGVDEGRVALEIRADLTTGNPVAAGAPNSTWVKIDPLSGAGVNPSGGMHSFPVNLDGLFALNITVAPGVRLQNVTCDIASVGFRAHYIPCGGPGDVCTVDPKVGQSASPGTDLGIQCNACGTLTDLTIAVAQSAGQGLPPPGFTGCWTFTITVQNCTDSDLTGVKIQGGSNGWTDNTQTTASSTGGSNELLNVKNNKKNSVITWTGDIAQGETVSIDVEVCGTIKSNAACGTVLFLNGPWSAAFTDPDTLLPVKTDYTGRLTIEVTCP
jgi:hypothetical protein